MPEQDVLVTSGLMFIRSSQNGDITPGTPQGFYAHDTRFLSALRLYIDGKETETLRAGRIGHESASFFSAYPRRKRSSDTIIGIARDRYVCEGMHEDVSLVNHTAETVSLKLEVIFDADFADIFEVGFNPVRKVGRVTVEERPGVNLCLVYRRDEYERETRITFSEQPQMQGKKAVFEIALEPRASWKTCISIAPFVPGGAPYHIPCIQAGLGQPFTIESQMRGHRATAPERPEPYEEGFPRLIAEDEGIQMVYRQAIWDLQALYMEHEPGCFILAAGAPWFMAVFGRDSIIAAIQTKLLGPELMRGTLHTLAALQAKKVDAFREAQPGKIAHEVRSGELSVFADVPHSGYYGSVDATPLFLVLLGEAYQWTGDQTLLEQTLPAAEAALHWLDRYGDLDRDGFVEYRGTTKRGLKNQGWKDSGDAISFANGKLAEGAIALCEVQGYVYWAKQTMAAIYERLGNPASARRLQRQAEKLKDHFNQAFWMPDAGYYALALDGQKRQIDSITSNPGQCLWTGIIDEDKAGHVVERLMAPDMFSGWGIRTMSTEMTRYHPISYHNGSVWPHDTSLVAAGMARYRYTTEGKEVAYSLIDAASAMPENRLPELFAGYPRRERSFPVPYPTANAPQAWASGAVIYSLETILGVMPAGERLLQEAPREDSVISLAGVQYRGARLVL